MPPIRVDDTDAQVGQSARQRLSRWEEPQPAWIIGGQGPRHRAISQLCNYEIAK